MKSKFLIKQINLFLTKNDCSFLRLIFRSVEILWNLLEYGDRNQVAQQLNSLVAISQIRDAFLQKLLQGYSNYDRQIRYF